MSKGQDKSVELKISRFEFKLTPVEVAFKETESQSYALQFCKGAQVHKKFSEVVWVHEGQKSCRMTYGESVIFKIHGQRGGTFEWSVYKVTDDEMKDYLCSVVVDIDHYYQQLHQDLKTKLKNAKNSNPTLSGEDYWKGLKENSLPYQLKSKVVEDKKQGIKITFDLLIGCELITEKDTQFNFKISKQTSKKGGSFEAQSSQQQESNPRQRITISIDKVLQDPKAEKKRDETLSDIIQTSNENSSMFKREQKNHRIQSNISEIPEQQKEEQSPMFPQYTKTHDFDSDNFQLQRFDTFNKKSHTLREEYDSSELKELENVRKNSKEGAMLFSFKETAPQSHITQKTQPSTVVEPKVKINKNSLGSYILLLVIICLVLSPLFLFGEDSNLSEGKVLAGNKGSRSKSSRKGAIFSGKLKSKTQRSKQSIPKDEQIVSKTYKKQIGLTQVISWISSVTSEWLWPQETSKKDQQGAKSSKKQNKLAPRGKKGNGRVKV